MAAYRPTVTVRQALDGDADAFGLITVSASLGTFLGAIPEERLDLGWRPEDSASGWRSALAELAPDQFMLAAQWDDRVVGFAWAGLAPDHRAEAGEVKGLYVAPTWQGRGVGRRLIGAAAQRLVALGASDLLIGCVEENPSCGFYRRLGGVEIGRRPAVVDRHRTEEILFHWPDVADLATGPGSG